MKVGAVILLVGACCTPARPTTAGPRVARRWKPTLDCPTGTAQVDVTDGTVCGVRIPTRPKKGVVAVCARPDGTHHGPFESGQPTLLFEPKTWIVQPSTSGSTSSTELVIPTRSTGSCKDGVANGTWSHWYAGELVRQADYLDGQLDGFWREWYEDGSPRVVGHYRRGKPWGVWSFWDRRGHKTTRARELRGSNEGVY